MILTVTIILFIILSIGTFIKTNFNIESQEESVGISLLGVILFTYIMGMLNILKYSINVIFITTGVCCVCNILNIIKKKVKIKDIITNPILIYIIISYVYAFFVKGRHYSSYDEFMFWGTNLKFMFEQDMLWVSNVFDGVHQTYVPLKGVIEYIFLKILNVWNEDVTILAISMTMFTLILPIFSNIKYSIKNTVKILINYIIIIALIILFQGNFVEIMVDTILGVMFLSRNVYGI